MSYTAWKLGFQLGEIPIYFPDRTVGTSKMDSKIAAEAALRVFQIMHRHRNLKPEMRRTATYSTPDST